jgi:hypothetical protein
MEGATMFLGGRFRSSAEDSSVITPFDVSIVIGRRLFGGYTLHAITRYTLHIAQKRSRD